MRVVVCLKQETDLILAQQEKETFTKRYKVVILVMIR